MDTREYFRERERMLNAYGRTGGVCVGVRCDNCPLHFNGQDICNAEEAVDIVEKWSKEHPKKTYLDVMLEAFPNTELNKSGTPPICVGIFNPLLFDCDSVNHNCAKCWNTEYKEDN